MIRVLEGGAFTTVQDLGRAGWAVAGVPPSGAMDAFALRTANRLAGNPEGAAGLEITMRGPRLAFEAGAVVAIAGAPFDGDLDGEPVPHNESFRVRAGGTLRLATARTGVRAYLAVRGGIAVPPVLGSRSTLVSAGLGGLLGRRLAERDYLRVGPQVADAPMRRLADKTGSDIRAGVLRAVPGPHDDAFTARGRDAFFSQTFGVSTRSDRAGVRLEGEPIEHADGADLDPEGVVTGAVQVPGDGSPIVLGPDRPVTGGYVTIGAVITADLSLIAQARPGETLRFERVDVSDARAAWREREAAFARAIEDVQ